VERVVLFYNKHFKEIARGFDKVIIDNIFSVLDKSKDTSLRNDVHLRDDFIIGFSIYQVSERYYTVFLSNISSKTIVFKAMEDRRYYEKLSVLFNELDQEVGNPLKALSNSLKKLAGRLKKMGNDEPKEAVDAISTEMGHLSRHIKKLKDLTILHQVTKKPYSLNAIVNNVFNLNKSIIRKKRISVDINIDESIVVMVDEDMICHILLTLFLNFIESIKQYGRISAEVVRVDEYLVQLGLVFTSRRQVQHKRCQYKRDMKNYEVDIKYSVHIYLDMLRSRFLYSMTPLLSTMPLPAMS
jgi:signal transduction histidine kinase